MPKIELSAGDGDSTQWISYKDRFSLMLHDMPELSDTMKLQFLLASLKGEVARLFDHVQLVEEHYAVTWQALKDRSDDLKLLMREYFGALVDLQLMAGPTAEELTRIVNESKRLIRGMER
uniref:Dynein heavy chain tail domain-containing protein n=1 Tax=Anopheles culicifacies TaxID=139723 RepID=A0A182MRT4_9DIPT